MISGYVTDVWLGATPEHVARPSDLKPYILEVAATELQVWDVIGEGEMIAQVWRSLSDRDAGVRILVGRCEIVWRDDRGIGPYQDAEWGDQQTWRTLDEGERLKVVRNFGCPLTRWRPF